MYYGYYGFDWTYLVLVLPCILLSLWASASVKNTFKRYSTQYSVRRITGADAAARARIAFGKHRRHKLTLSGKKFVRKQVQCGKICAILIPCIRMDACTR